MVGGMQEQLIGNPIQAILYEFRHLPRLIKIK